MKIFLHLSFFTFLAATTSLYAQIAEPKTIFTHADTLRGSLSALRSCYDIKFYHLDVKFNIDQKFISGSNQFVFTATRDFTRLQFDLFANLKIDSILYHEKELPFTRERNAVFVTFPITLKKGLKDDFKVYYSGNPSIAKKGPRDGGITFEKDSLGNPFVATACEGPGASIWWPTKDQLADEVDSMLISISVPSKLKDVSNGHLRKVTDLKNGYTRYDWFVSSPINNYNVAANIANYTHFSESYQGEKGNLTLDYWVLPYNLKRAKIDFERNVKTMLAAYEHWYGPYPFYKDGYKLVETPYPAMEHQSAISYGGYMKGGPKNELIVEGKKSWDYVIVHESAHEWFGNSITAQDLGDLWIHEAFATYSESLFVESLYGKQTGQAYVYRSRAGISNDEPIVAPYGVNHMGSGDMYAKGSALLNMVRTIINDDEKWRKILRGLNGTFYHETVTYDQIVSYISEKSGKNLLAVFDQYLHYSSLPILEFTTINGKLNSRWIADAKGFNMSILMKIKGGKYQFVSPSTKFRPVSIAGATTENIEVDLFNYYYKVRPLISSKKL